VDSRCRASLLEALRHASEAANGRLKPIDAADKIASQLGDCFPFLQADNDLVDQLAAIAGLADEYDELWHDPVKSKEIESDIIEAIRDFVALGQVNGLTPS
jgi:hypothetical protein